MTDDEAAKVMSRLIDKMMAEAFGLPTKPNSPTVLRYVNGRFESREIDEADITIEPPRCNCGPVVHWRSDCPFAYGLS